MLHADVKLLQRMMKMLTLDTYGRFNWNYGKEWHIETDVGNYEWSDPDVGGDNTIRPCKPLKEWTEKLGLPYARAKGSHPIRKLCGDNVNIIV